MDKDGVVLSIDGGYLWKEETCLIRMIGFVSENVEKSKKVIGEILDGWNVSEN